MTMDEDSAKREMQWKRIASLAQHIVDLAKSHNYDKDAVFLTIARNKEVADTAEQIWELTSRV